MLNNLLFNEGIFMKLTLFLALISLNSFSDCQTKKVICNSQDQKNDYVLTNKECLYGEMDQYSSKIYKYTKTFSYFTEINKIDNTENTINFSEHEFYKDDYQNILVSYQINQFSLYNRDLQKMIYIDLRDHNCKVTKTNTRK